MGRTRGEERLQSRFNPGRVPDLVSIEDGEHDPWRVQVTVCMVNGSCVDAARGNTAMTTAIERGGN